MEIDLRDVGRIGRRRWWIVALAILAFAALGYLLARQQDPEYAATSTILVISGQPDDANAYTSLQASRSLAETYRRLIKTGPVLDRVNESLGETIDFATFDKIVSTSVVADTQLVDVRVADADPARAAELANLIAVEFQAYITDQVDPRIGAQVEIADPARLPSDPFSPQPLKWAVLAAVLGTLIGISLVALIEFLDRTVKAETNLQELTDAPLLAAITSAGTLAAGSSQLFTLTQPRSGAAEATRLLRTNLEFVAASFPLTSLTITSPEASDGKSTLTANLGIVMAQSGKTVVIIDADLRKPTQHRIFAVPNERGLTTWLTHPEADWRTAALAVGEPGLSLIPSGPLPPNPADLLSSDRFEQLLMRIAHDVDLILIDAPPILLASDALNIASRSSGVLLICQSHKTRRDALRKAADALHQGGIRIIGVVLNRQKEQSGESYYGSN